MCISSPLLHRRSIHSIRVPSSREVLFVLCRSSERVPRVIHVSRKLGACACRPKISRVFISSESGSNNMFLSSTSLIPTTSGTLAFEPSLSCRPTPPQWRFIFNDSVQLQCAIPSEAATIPARSVPLEQTVSLVRPNNNM